MEELNRRERRENNFYRGGAEARRRTGLNKNSDRVLTAIFAEMGLPKRQELRAKG
jgi:hypothetical protein